MTSSKYTPGTDLKEVFPHGLSLECCEGDQHAKLIEFTQDLPREMWTFDRLDYSGPFLDGIVQNAVRTSPIPLYHSHVLWSVAHQTTRLPDGSIEFSLAHIGPHIECADGHTLDDGELRNHPDRLNKPDIVAATYTFTDKNGKEKESFEFNPANLVSVKLFTRDELDKYAVDDWLYIRLRIIIARSYFSLPMLLEEPTTVPEQTADLVKRILRGEKMAGSDWAITVTLDGGGDDGGLPLNYHVHSEVFARVSEKFKLAFSTGRSVDDDIIVDPRRKPNSCTVPALAPDDMPVIISLAYGIDPPLPTNIDRVGKMGRAIASLFDVDIVFPVLFAQWERAICEEALALDKRDINSFTAIKRLLMIVWCAPYGFLPVAKRVAIGVFADMLWLNVPSARDYSDFLDNKVPQTRLDEYFQIIQIIKSAYAHSNTVTAVRKIGLATKKKDEQPPTVRAADVESMNNDGISTNKKEDEQSPTVPTDSARDPAAPTVVSIDDGMDDESEEKEEPAKWQCTIS